MYRVQQLNIVTKRF